MSTRSVRTHSTQDELNYIDAIGQHSDFTKNIPKLDMLIKYLEATKKRIDWTGLDKVKIISHVRRELALCTT